MCEEASNGDVVEGGWGCLFAPMAHLCTFDKAPVRKLVGLSGTTQDHTTKRNGIYVEEMSKIPCIVTIHYKK